ncbi:2-octaprenyl-6-methoxyphenyl hydroxylase [Chelatococcus reniformis]|uniref:2-octaprenyl-6-methoxyphenyl hydroxylase n=2 Tax=Chelatococcus reniformis TaxID=1494448 RepID=A0A916U134_9HYPH|nr:2-octaprenyl-6-methoxyphenyl hydroxylase [Chelatococcus reniformis]
MAEPMNERPAHIAVVGAGATGLAAAITFARDGFDTVLIGRPSGQADGRTVALLDGSVTFLAAIGAWRQLAPAAAPMTCMRIVDATGSLFAPPPLTFHASEIGLDAFGYNIENAALVDGLAQVARATPRLTIRDAPLAAADSHAAGLRLTLADGDTLEPPLVVGADGRQSLVRHALDVAVRTWTYRQTALTAIFAHARPHRDTSTELHTRGGPFTLVPLPGRRSSLVWVCPPYQARRLRRMTADELASAVERQAQSMLGAMTLEGHCGVVPMQGLSVARFAGHGAALVGEAAHVFPPIGAQGLNLGLRDVAALRDVIVDARSRGQAIADATAMSRFSRGRLVDARTRTGVIDALNRSLLLDMLPLDLVRGAAMLTLDAAGPLRRLVMREGLAPRLGLPSLMRRAGAGFAS